MADSRGTDLITTDPIASTDLVYLIIDPATDPDTRTTTIANMLDGKVVSDLASAPDWVQKGDLIVGTAENTAQILPAGSNAQKLISDSSEATGLKWIDDDIGCSIVIGDGQNVITTGVKGYLEIPVDFTIESVSIVADVSGSCVVDIWKDTYANFPPVDADSITSATPPTLSAAQKATDSTLTSWTKTCAKGEWLGFNVDSCSTIKQITVGIKGKRTATS